MAPAFKKLCLSSSYKAIDPVPFPALDLNKASYQSIWVRLSSESTAKKTEALISPSSGLAFMQHSASANVNPNRNKPIYRCYELQQGPDGVYEPTERREVVVKAARLSKRELEQVNNCKTCRPRRRGGDEPLEEVKAMAYLGQKAANHCIAPLLDSFLDKEGWLYIVQPFYARKDLVEVLSSKASREGSLSPSYVRSMFLRLLEALRHLKSQGVGHLDISPENCFVSAEGEVFLADMGMALFVGPQDVDKYGSSAVDGEGERRRRSPTLLTPQAFRGKSAYHGPEVFTQKAFDPFAADIFSLGCTLFAVLTGRLLIEPADGSEYRPRFDALCREDFCALFKFERSAEVLPPLAADLIKGMTRADPKKRLTLEEIYTHEWITEHDE